MTDPGRHMEAEIAEAPGVFARAVAQSVQVPGRFRAVYTIARGWFRDAGGDVHRIRPSDAGAVGLTPAAAAAVLLYLTYPLVLALARALGHDPDHPATLSKVTQTT